MEALSRSGKRAASVLIEARILLKADTGEDGPGWDDERIAEALDCGESTVYRVRQAFVERGLEARLIALACSAPPEGRSHSAGRTGVGGSEQGWLTPEAALPDDAALAIHVARLSALPVQCLSGLDPWRD